MYSGSVRIRSNMSGFKCREEKLVMVSIVERRRRVISVLPVLLCVILISLPNGARGKKTEEKIGNFSQSPTNHEEIMSKKKDIPLPTEGSDDYWVGSHKLDFKPHPLLMTQSTIPPKSQIPVPFISLGMPPTLTPDSFADDEGSSEEEEEVVTKKGKRKSRDKRKKQRKLDHRQLWANNSANTAFLRALQSNPQLLQQHPAYPNLRQPVLLTAEGAMMAPPLQSPFVLAPPPSDRNDESFHGSATTWNINHPNNNLPNYYPPTSNLGEGGPPEGSSGFRGSVQSMPFGYPPLPHQRLPMPPHLSSQSMSDQDTDLVVGNNPAFPSPAGSAPLGRNAGGPIIVYVTPSGRGMAQASASGPIPLKAFNNINEIPVDIMKPHIHYLPHSPSGGNPQFMRNNFLRMFMDRLASVGKVLPIPFVTKYHPPHSRHTLHRRM